MEDQRLIAIVPSEKQLRQQQLEFYAFVCFGVNTFTGLEWGFGTESPRVFNPTELNTDQWVESIKASTMKAIILTCKHHDGFCLWPSKYTEYSVKNSPYKDGKGDIVRELSDSCAKYGLKFGVYLSPWDRNNATYGYGKAYDEYFENQLTELLTQYGDIFTIWFDGACGEGTNGKKQIYDWDRYYTVIRKLMPDATISICGEDIRWCGNEAGDTRESEWSVVPKALRVNEQIAKISQQSDEHTFREKPLTNSDKDLGSRKVVEGLTDLVWYPSEVDTSIRPGWYYHTEEDEKIRSFKTLIDIYYRSVGGNNMLLLNVPPDTRGLLYKTDVLRLKEIGDYIRHRFSHNLMADIARIRSDYDDGENIITNTLVDDLDTYFKTKDGQKTATIEITFKSPVIIKNIVLKENIRLSQRIENFEVFYLLHKNKIPVYRGTTIGYKKIIQVLDTTADALVIKITDSRVAPTLAFIGIY